MAAANITVVVLEPGKPGEVREIPNTLEALQGAIGGGYVEVFHNSASSAFVYCDEEGDLKKLPPNKQIGAHEVVGTALFARHESNDTVSLTPEQVARVKALYG